ncbi:hypothetical protein [Kitasatospora sp. NPDC093806]|uniref:hypothetical protein n=1 Tax=Kitasatospora sp. NPDC093806 TaxID=3155075 RepID=UPI003440B0E6
MEVAFRWSGTGEERVRSFANSRPTAGGTHTVGFRDGVAVAMTAFARERRLLTALDSEISDDRIGEGLTAVVSVKLDDLELQGSLREVLGNTAVRACVGQAVREHLGRWLEEHPEQGVAALDRIVRAARRG